MNRPTSTPIYQTATFEQPNALDFGAYDYTRSGNPTRDLFAEALAELEHGAGAVVTSTGMSAIALVEEGRAVSDDAIREWMSGNICRCGAYPHILAAIKDVAGSGSRS